MTPDHVVPDGADLPAPRARLLVGPRFAPGPLRLAKPPRQSSGAGRGALVGGLVGLAVLAAMSLPFVVSGGEPRPMQRHSEAAARSVALRTTMPAAEPAPMREEPAAIPSAAAPTVAPVVPRANAAAFGLETLPSLSQEVSEMDPDPVVPAPRPVPRAAPAARKASIQR